MIFLFSIISNFIIGYRYFAKLHTTASYIIIIYLHIWIVKETCFPWLFLIYIFPANIFLVKWYFLYIYLFKGYVIALKWFDHEVKFLKNGRYLQTYSVYLIMYWEYAVTSAEVQKNYLVELKTRDYYTKFFTQN